MTPISFAVKAFDSLSLRELYDVLHLRDLVFVVGQGITSEPEVDGEDPLAHHGLVRDPLGRLVGTFRLFLGESPIRVGRIAVHPELQRGGVGTEMMRRLADYLGDRPALMHAQAYLEPWYRRLGWQSYGERYLEAEIEHISMRKPHISHGERTAP